MEARVSRALIARSRLSNRRAHEATAFSHDGLHYVGGVGRFDDGSIAELYISAAKAGTAVEAWARDSAIVASLALQSGVDIDVLRRALSRDDHGAPATPLAALLDLLAEGNA